MQGISFLQVWQFTVIVTLATGWHHRQVAIKTGYTTFRGQFVVTGGHRHGGGGKLRLGHLTGNKLLPNQLIELSRIRFHIVETARSNIDVRGTDGFVSFLGAGLAAVDFWFGGQIACTMTHFNVVATGFYCVGTQVGGIRTHIRDVTRFVVGVAAVFEVCMDCPVLLRLKRANLSLALYNHF